MRLEPNIRKRRDIADGAGIDRRHCRKQRKTINPADEPAVAWPDVVLAVLVERAGQRIFACKFTEDQGYQHHAADDDRNRPNVTWAASTETQRIQRIDADHWAQVAEGNGEVVEE